MAHISATETTDLALDTRAEQPASRLAALSGVLMFTGSALITIAAIIKWWPVSIVLFVAAAVAFWTLVAITATDDPNEVRLDLRDA